MLENFNEDKRKNPMTQFSDFDSLLSPIFLRCSRTLRFHTGWSISLMEYSNRVRSFQRRRVRKGQSQT